MGKDIELSELDRPRILIVRVGVITDAIVVRLAVKMAVDEDERSQDERDVEGDDGDGGDHALSLDRRRL